MGIIPENKVAQEDLPAAEINKLRDAGYTVDLNAGETINGGTLPVAIYIDDTTNEVYACDANDTSKLEFIGFAISNSTDGNSIQIQNNGIVSGFTGLDIGKKYYIQDDQTIGTSVGTYDVLVGIAVSATQLLIQRGTMEYIGTDTVTANSGSAASINDTSAMPANAKMAVLNIQWGGSSTSPNQGQLIIFRNGFTTTKAIFGSEPSSYHITMSISGSTITVTETHSAGGSVELSFSGTIHFYR